MNRSIFFIAIFTIFSLQVRADDYPFYFFALRIMNLPNVQETAGAEKELCSFITKNCELSKEKGLKFSIMKLHDGPDEKSKVVGAFVNALKDGCYGNDEDIDHCRKSGKASFVVLIDGTRLSLDHYLSVDGEAFDNYTFSRQRFRVGEYPHNYLRYVRALDAMPKKEVSFYEPSPHWYALASPKKDNKKLWLRYESDLRSPYLAAIEFGMDRTLAEPNTCSVMFKYFSEAQISKLKKSYVQGISISRDDPCYHAHYYICGTGNQSVRLIALGVMENEKNVFSKSRNFFKLSFSEMRRKYSSSKLDNSICESFPKDAVIELPLSVFYEDGFLKNSVRLYFLEEMRMHERKAYLEDKMK